LSKPIEILLVEDDPYDAQLTALALRRGRIASRLVVVEDGVEALAYLHEEGPYAGSPRPDLILLDVNLPRKSGRQVLAEVKDDPDLRRIPIVVFTGSSSEEDVLSSYDLHANAYVRKPTDPEQFTGVLEAIHDFWLRVATLPPA
jgi:CheY-like chemotaxis protein